MAETHNSISCAEFEALLSLALDGDAMPPAEQQRFAAHRSACTGCARMFAEAEAGKNWLAMLEDAEPPASLMHDILVATVGSESTRAVERVREIKGWRERVRGWFTPVFQPVLQPRFVMSFAMAFFSISAGLSLGGVKLDRLRAGDLRPGNMATAAVRTYHETTARVQHYYDNLRFVYEIESRVRELKNAVPDNSELPEKAPPKPGNPQPKDDKLQNRNLNHGDEPGRHHDHQQYSRDQAAVSVVARLSPGHALPPGPPAPRLLPTESPVLNGRIG